MLDLGIVTQEIKKNKEEPTEKRIDTPIKRQQREEYMVNVDTAVQQWKIYQKLTNQLLDESDYQKIGARKFKKKSAWRKLGRAFNISTTIIDKELSKTEKGQVKEAIFVVRAMSPDGRCAEGWGNCSKSERKFTKPNHDIPATAMTRATNRAISDLIGAGEVTAEEMQPNRTIHRRNTSPDFEIPPEIEKEIHQKIGKKGA